MNEKLADQLADLGFPPIAEVGGRCSIADMYSPDERCGLYVLRFTTDELYCGQAVDVTRRYLQHRKTHPDIVGLSFRQVAREELDRAERTTIEELEIQGWQLRNVALTSIPKGESDFDLIMSVEDQERWLKDVTFRPQGNLRTNDVQIRRKHAHKFDRLRGTPWADDIVCLLRAYVAAALPLPNESELTFWSCTCLPGGADRVLVRVNLNMQEVLTLYEDQGELCVSWHCTCSTFDDLDDDTWNDLVRRLDFDFIDHRYGPGGPDQINVGCVGLSSALAIVEEPTMIQAMRLLNLRLMKKGPTYFSRSHCFGLIDALWCESQPL